MSLEAVADDLAIGSEAALVLRQHVGLPIKADNVPGGVVHRVLRLAGPRGAVIAKQRLDYCYRLPTIPSNASEARFEAAALQCLGDVAPLVWPKLLAFDESTNTLLMSDLLRTGLSDGRSAIQAMPRSDVVPFVTKVANWLGTTHRRLRSLSQKNIRPDGDVAFLARNIFERIGYHRTPAAMRLAESVSLLPRQLIIGDFEPKNMLIGTGEFFCFDAEHVHAGPAVFDLAFFIGHVVLERIACDTSELTAAVISAGETAYIEAAAPRDAEGMNLLGPLIAATLLYRMRNAIVPYFVGPVSINLGEVSSILDASLAERGIDSAALIAAELALAIKS